MVSPSRHHHHVHLHKTAAHEYAAERHLEARLPLRHQRALQSRHRHDVAARVPSLPCLPWGFLSVPSYGLLSLMIVPILCAPTPSPPGALSCGTLKNGSRHRRRAIVVPTVYPAFLKSALGAYPVQKGRQCSCLAACALRVTDTYWRRSVSRLHHAVLYAPAGEEDDGETSGVRMGRRPIGSDEGSASPGARQRGRPGLDADL